MVVQARQREVEEIAACAGTALTAVVLAAARTNAALVGINDIDRLERMSERLLDVKSWAELLATA